jgi:DNA topoisomerase I
MPRLRTVSPDSPGWSRRRAGKGFVYLDEAGNRVSPEDAERIRSLAIPPAWREVWICPVANGHLQAVGTDDAGRRQYLYHPAWREKRDQAKFARVTAAAHRLPAARRRVARDLAASGMPLERAAATAVRLLDLGYFRIGADAYAEDNGSFGLTTLERQHVRRRGELIVFHFVGKSGIEHTVEIDDDAAIQAIEVLRKRRTTSARLLAYRSSRAWSDLDAAAVNAYLADLLGGELTAKDFRTWHATVLAALALATSDEPGDTRASRRRAVKAAVEEVAGYLGNTPTMARKSYIDPRVLDLFETGTTIDVDVSRFRSPERRQAAVETAVLALLADTSG